MGMEVEQTDKVVIQAARSAHCKRHENDCIWKVSVQSPIMQIPSEVTVLQYAVTVS